MVREKVREEAERILGRKIEAEAGRHPRKYAPYLMGEEEALEYAADALLRRGKTAPDYPAYTDERMARQSAIHHAAAVETIGETLIAPVSQTLEDELCFLASVTPLSGAERLCLACWLRGWKQEEIRARWESLQDLATQQRVSRVLRSALRKCYASRIVTFAQFSRHSVYRRPARRWENWRIRACPYCGERHIASQGTGRYCSSFCRGAAREHRAGD